MRKAEVRHIELFLVSHLLLDPFQSIIGCTATMNHTKVEDMIEFRIAAKMEDI